MRKILPITFLFLLMTLNVIGMITDSGFWGILKNIEKEVGFNNGIRKTVVSTYYQGYADGMLMFSEYKKKSQSENLHFDDEKIMNILLKNRLRLDEAVKALDQFYNDYRNKKVPIGGALYFIDMKRIGADTQELNDYLRQLRRQFKNDKQ